MANTTKTLQMLNVNNLRKGDIFTTLSDDKGYIYRGEIYQFVSKAGPFIYLIKYNSSVGKFGDTIYHIDLDSPNFIGFIRVNSNIIKKVDK